MTESNSYPRTKRCLTNGQRVALQDFVNKIHELLEMCAHGNVSIEAHNFIERHLTPGQLYAVVKLFQEPEDNMPDALLGPIRFPGSAVWDCNPLVQELVRTLVLCQIGAASPSDTVFRTPEQERNRKFAFQKLGEYVSAIELVLESPEWKERASLTASSNPLTAACDETNDSSLTVPGAIPAENDAADTANVWRYAADVLETLAWIEGQPSPFGEHLEFSPEAAEAWSVCHKAVWKLPRKGKPLSVERHLQTIFPATWELPRPAGHINGDIIERWDPPKAGPWVTRSDISKLRIRATLNHELVPSNSEPPSQSPGNPHADSSLSKLEIPQWVLQMLHADGKPYRLPVDDFFRLRAFLPDTFRRMMQLPNSPLGAAIEKYNRVMPQLVVLRDYNQSLHVTPESVDTKLASEAKETISESQPGSKAPVEGAIRIPTLENWAFGYDGIKQWWLFHKEQGRWSKPTKVRIPGGLPTQLLLLIAQNNGRTSSESIVAWMKTGAPRTPLRRHKRSMSENLCRAKKAMKLALSSACKCQLVNVPEPLYVEDEDWVVKVEIGETLMEPKIGPVFVRLFDN